MYDNVNFGLDMCASAVVYLAPNLDLASAPDSPDPNKQNEQKCRDITCLCAARYYFQNYSGLYIFFVAINLCNSTGHTRK